MLRPELAGLPWGSEASVAELLPLPLPLPGPGHVAVHSLTALMSLPSPDYTLIDPHIALPVIWTLVELWASAEQG